MAIERILTARGGPHHWSVRPKQGKEVAPGPAYYADNRDFSRRFWPGYAANMEKARLFQGFLRVSACILGLRAVKSARSCARFPSTTTEPGRSFSNQPFQFPVLSP
jgi:hypothetical protein